MLTRGGGVRPVAWLVLVGALAVGAVGVVTRSHPTSTGAVAPAAEASHPGARGAGRSGPPGADPSGADPSGADPSGAEPPVSLPGSVALSSIPSPLPDETATGGATAGQLTVVDPPAGTAAAQASAPPGPDGVPGVPLAAYRHAEQVLGLAQPGCRLHWPLLAAIGRAETGNAQDGRVDASGRTIGRILGPRLDGSPGLDRVPDTDRGQLDGDPSWDRAVGPMQLLPSAWRRYAADGDGDGRTQPDDVFDAALTAGRYLCAGGADLGDPRQMSTAVFRYRHSASYVTSVTGWTAGYARGAAQVPLLAPVPRAPVVLPAPGGSADQAVAAAPSAAAGSPPGAGSPGLVTRPAPARRPTAAATAVHPPAARRAVPGVRKPPTPARPAPDRPADAPARPAPSADAAPTALMPVISPYSDGQEQASPDATGPVREQPPAPAQNPGRMPAPAGTSDPGSGYVIIIPESRAANAGALTPLGAAQPPGPSQPSSVPLPATDP